MTKNEFRRIDKILNLIEQAIDDDIELPGGLADAAEVARDEIGAMWSAHVSIDGQRDSNRSAA